MAQVRSMTGFGRAEVEEEGIRVRAEVKSVNHRYKEISVKLPKGMIFAEPHVRQLVGSSVERGRVDVYIHVEFEGAEGKSVSVNRELALLLWREIKELSCEMGAPLPSVSPILREVLSVREDVEEERLLSVILKATTGALERLVAFRAEEGDRLRRDILRRMGRIEDFVEKADSIAEIATREAKEKLVERLKELEIEDARVAQEVAIMLDKLDVTEELVRLKSHIKAFLETLEAGSPCGRKLDFIIQEMFREANTLGVKAASSQLTMLAVDLKTEIEKIREQVQNLE